MTAPTVYLNTALDAVAEALVQHPQLTAGPFVLTEHRGDDVLLDGYLVVPTSWLAARFYVAAQGAAWTVREASDDPMGRMVAHVAQRRGAESWTQCHQRALAMAAALNAGQLPVGLAGRMDPHDDAGWSFVDDTGMRWACTVTDRSDLDGAPTEAVVDDGTTERTVVRVDPMGLVWLVTA